VVTYNVRKGLAIREAGEVLLGAEHLDDADVILLQEMDEDGTDQIAQYLQADFVYYPGFRRRSGRRAGNAILARRRLTETRKVLLPGLHPLNGQRRIGVRAMVRAGERDVAVYSVHTETYSTRAAYRSAQVAALVDDIGAGTCPVIVGGDFNTASRRSVRRMADQFASIGLEHASAKAGPTISKLGLRVAVDHVFARGFRVLASGAVEEARASDHWPVWVELGDAPISTDQP
jgi:endonuclease/exonuclease/phosphatase family metal-dependent hydrolase